LPGIGEQVEGGGDSELEQVLPGLRGVQPATVFPGLSAEVVGGEEQQAELDIPDLGHGEGG
jgi:hypothetical protein